jgi:dipeptidyl aminopeptidase/acylaminoacyl peptidase
VSDLSGAEEIWVCDADGANAAQLTRLGGEIGCIRLRWSPDGRSLTFSASPEGRNAVYTVNANGGSPQRLTMDPGSSSEPYWSGDGKWILFGLIDAAGKMGIFKLPAGGGSPVQVTDDPGWMPMESPDGKFVYYHKSESEGFSLWRVASTGGETRKVFDLRGWGVVETLTSRGAYWIQWSNNSLHFLDTATGKTERLASFPKPVMGYSVSPNGRQSVYGQLDQSGSDLMLVENFR